MSDFTTGPEVAAFVARLAGHWHGEFTAMGFERDGALEAGVVFCGWEPERSRVEMHCAATNPRWMTWPRARVIFGYAFSFCGLVYARSEHPVIHRTFRLLGGTVTPTPVWTVVALAKENAHGRLALDAEAARSGENGFRADRRQRLDRRRQPDDGER